MPNHSPTLLALTTHYNTGEEHQDDQGGGTINEERRRTQENAKSDDDGRRTTLQPSVAFVHHVSEVAYAAVVAKLSGTMSVTKHACISRLNVLGPRAKLGVYKRSGDGW